MQGLSQVLMTLYAY